MKLDNFAIGIDIGGTNTVFGLVNSQGDIIARGHIPTLGFATAQEFLKALSQNMQAMMSNYPQAMIQGIGVGAPNGNVYTGEILNAANLPWKGVIPLATVLKEMLGMKVWVTNDANAAAIGEMIYGVAKGMKDFIMVTLGTGVGSGFVSNGQLIYGHDGFAGELGHIIAIREGRDCGCGRKGCLETYTSATGIVRTAKERLERYSKGSSSLQLANKLTAESIFQAAEMGDALARDIFQFTGKILGQTLADVVAITSPEAIIFFGGLAHAGKWILEPTQHHMEANLLSLYKNKVKFLLSALPDADVAILGASALVWQASNH
ncbi:MAG: ROK family protein [Bacteroidetes bacterium]|nr:ROK family protein [Bacteroidota bacterium]